MLEVREAVSLEDGKLEKKSGSEERESYLAFDVDLAEGCALGCLEEPA